MSCRLQQMHASSANEYDNKSLPPLLLLHPPILPLPLSLLCERRLLKIQPRVSNDVCSRHEAADAAAAAVMCRARMVICITIHSTKPISDADVATDLNIASRAGSITREQES